MNIADALRTAEEYRTEMLGRHLVELAVVDTYIGQLRKQGAQTVQDFAKKEKLSITVNRAAAAISQRPAKPITIKVKGRYATNPEPAPKKRGPYKKRTSKLDEALEARKDPEQTEPIKVDEQHLKSISVPRENATASDFAHNPNYGHSKLADAMRIVIKDLPDGFARLDVTSAVNAKFPEHEGKTSAMCVILLDMLGRGELTREGQGSAAVYSKAKLREPKT